MTDTLHTPAPSRWSGEVADDDRFFDGFARHPASRPDLLVETLVVPLEPDRRFSLGSPFACLVHVEVLSWLGPSSDLPPDDGCWCIIAPGEPLALPFEAPGPATAAVVRLTVLP